MHGPDPHPVQIAMAVLAGVALLTLLVVALRGELCPKCGGRLEDDHDTVWGAGGWFDRWTCPACKKRFRRHLS